MSRSTRAGGRAKTRAGGRALGTRVARVLREVVRSQSNDRSRGEGRAACSRREGRGEGVAPARPRIAPPPKGEARPCAAEGRGGERAATVDGCGRSCAAEREEKGRALGRNAFGVPGRRESPRRQPAWTDEVPSAASADTPAGADLAPDLSTRAMPASLALAHLGARVRVGAPRAGGRGAPARAPAPPASRVVASPPPPPSGRLPSSPRSRPRSSSSPGTRTSSWTGAA